MNDEHEQDYKDAHEGKIGAKRISLGLSIIPDKIRGDMDAVIKLKKQIQTLLDTIDEYKDLWLEEHI